MDLETERVTGDVIVAGEEQKTYRDTPTAR